MKRERGHVGTVTCGHALARGGKLARGHGDTGDAELKGGSMGRPDDWLGGAYDRSINPGLRFPFERTIAATCHLGPSPVTGNEFVPADAMSSHPYRWEMTG